MEVYILDSLLRRTEVVDRFISLIWTERFAEIGEFEMVLDPSMEMRSLFTVGTRLAMNQSKRVMVVESAEVKTDDDGKKTLEVKGPSLEVAINDRIAKGSMTDLVTEPKWVLTGTPGDIARQMFSDICITGTLNINDVMPFVTMGNIYPEDTIPEPVDTITYEAELDQLYNAIKKLCDIYELGIRLVRDPTVSQLYFNIYAGNDRSVLQSDLEPVIFSYNLENLHNSSEYTSIAGAKNCAYVFSSYGYEVVYADNVDPETHGFDRHIITVKVDDIPDGATPAEASATMIQRGKEALSQNRTLSAFDGELDQHSAYTYGVDYELGDLVTIRSSDGVTSNMRVTEQIFASDEQGDRSYPTLAINLYINPDSWLGWDYSKVWADMGETEYWEDA